MYAGQDSRVGWNVSGDHYDTRRLTQYKAVVFNYNVNLPYNNGAYVRANTRSNSDPCGYFGNALRCQVIDNIQAAGWNSPHSIYEDRPIMVPDEVGWKYCTSWGYYYESYYGTRKGGSGSFGYTPTGYNYWYNFNASCRTIAKKPSAVIWNGNFLTNGGVTTSSAKRFDAATMGALANGPQTLYGSWVEHLGAVNKNVKGFATGSSFAIGSKNLTAPESPLEGLENSTLTISNKNPLGWSNILSNSTYRTRLTTYLENQVPPQPGGTLPGISSSSITGTKILRYNGDLTISGDIIVPSGPYSSIYHIPRVIIFVRGNLYITSDVQRLDAWIIVDQRNDSGTDVGGTIYTCSDFRLNVTEADALGKPSNACSKQLVFNGPVYARAIELRRSYGSDPLISRPGTFGATSSKWSAGEIFNYRLDNYLWAYAQAGRYKSSYTESYTRELAPRY